MSKQKSLEDVSIALDAAQSAVDEIARRSLYEDPPKLSFEQKIIHAARQLEAGAPLEDYLDEDEVREAIDRLSDMLTAAGVRMPEEWY